MANLRDWDRAVKNNKQHKTALVIAVGVGKPKRGGKDWEGSPKDTAGDKRMAKRRGMPLKQWERSAADKRHDRDGR